jgi:hypothetical protein
MPKTDQWVQVHSVDLTAGVDKTMPHQSTVYAGAVGVLQAGLNALYVAVQGSPSGVQRYDLVNGIANNGAGGSSACLAIWPGADQTRIFTACGTALTTSNGTDDMKLLGTMFTSTQGDAQFISQGASNVYIIRGGITVQQPTTEDQKVEVYSATTFALTGTMELPCFHTATRDVLSHGRFVFSTKAGKVVVLVQAEPGTSIGGDWGISVL